MQSKNDAASRIEQVLVQELLKGQYPMGSHLPTVRELAERFDVNVATVQRALARLEATGLVTARQGSGILVEDPAATVEVSLAPALLQAALNDPARRRRLLMDFLNVRRALLTAMMIEHRATVVAAGGTLLSAAIELGNVPDSDIAGKLEADATFVRALLRLTGDNTILVSLANTALRMLRQVRPLTEAYYADSDVLRANNLAILQALLTHSDPGVLWGKLNGIMLQMDESIVERFEAAMATGGDSDRGDPA